MSDKTKVPEPARKKREYEVGRCKPPVEHQFKPGNPGRQVGSRNKLSEAFLTDLYELWEDQGSAILKTLAADDPAVIVRACVAILPKQLNIRTDPLDEMTDDQLREHAKRVAAELGPLLAFAGIPEDAGEAQGKTRH